MPSMRGSTNAYQKSDFPCESFSFTESLDGMSGDNCQNPKSPYGLFGGLTVDDIALDLIDFTKEVKLNQTTTPIIYYGRGFGSYVINRALFFNLTIADSIILDSAWSPFTNALDWDVQRDRIAKNILSNIFPENNKEYSSATTTSALSSYKKISADIQNQRAICGQRPSEGFDSAWGQVTAASIFDDSLRHRFMQLLTEFEKCEYSGYGSALSYVDARIGDSKYSFVTFRRFTKTTESTALINNVILSELIDPSTLANARRYQLDFSFRVSGYVNLLLSGGWSTYAPSPYKGRVANYTGPILILNGDLDPQSSVQSAVNLSSYYPNSKLVIMPGRMDDCVFKSKLESTLESTCGSNLVSQFLNCPTCTLNTSCVNETSYVTFHPTQTSRLFFNSYIWKSRYIAPTVNNIVFSIIFSLCIPLVVILFVLLIVYKNNKRVTSRSFAPHVGLIFVFVFRVMLVLSRSSQYASLPLVGIGIIIQECLLISAAFVMVSQIVRFYALTFIYKKMAHKQSISKLVNLLVNGKILIVLFLVIFFVWLCFGIITYVTSFYTSYVVFTAYLTTTIVVAVILAVTAIVLGIINIVVQLVITKFDFKSVLFQGDPLHFRIDSVVLIPTIAAGIVGNVINSITVGNASLLIFSDVMLEIFLLLLMLYYGSPVIFCLLDTINNMNAVRVVFVDQTARSDNIDLNNMVDVIERMMKNDVARGLVENYCVHEFSLENVIAFLEVEQVKADGINFDTLKQLHNKYVVDGAQNQLNLPSKLVQNYKRVLTEESRAEINDIIESLRNAIIANLLDTFSRFIITADYEKAVAAVKSIEKMRSVLN
ncbi:RGS7 [Acrasis kona]|uniref:RGS7 n=1 Tax=Acrasis kona TaxID=1008807 RepID=A0AAW2ZM22_9EUKA